MCYKWRHPISAYVFISCLEILFALIKNYVYTVYADHTIFFKRWKFHCSNSETFKLLSDFLGLKPNTIKCKIAGIGVLKGVQAAICGIKCINLRNKTIKILSVYFSYN